VDHSHTSQRRDGGQTSWGAYFDEGVFALRDARAVRGPVYKGTSLIRKRTFLGPYSRPKPVVLGGGRFLMSEVPL